MNIIAKNETDNIVIQVADYQDPSQAAHIVQLMDEYASHPMGGGKPLSAYSREHLVSKLATIPHAVSILCYVAGKPAGLVNTFQGFSTFKCQPLMNIHDMIVSEAYRGLGLTRKMLAKAEQIAREQGCCKLTLEVLEGNPIAQQAYRRYGFDSYELDPMFGKAMFWEKVF